jgi:ABC-type branched-subunit amino acid transport system ATPase component
MTLDVRNVRVHFEGVKAVDGVDVQLGRKQILGLIGPNGAGKTTLVNAISGFQRPTSGSVNLGGESVTGWPPHRLARVGLARTFQNVRPFNSLTVQENVEAAAVAVGGRRRKARGRVRDILQRLGLGDQADVRAEALSAGEERRLGIARALATDPKYLLLDEPAAGLDDAESRELTATLRQLRAEFEYGMLVIEHDMEVVMNLCERVQVLDYGKTIALGTPAEIQRSEQVVAAYLGTHASEAEGRS